VDRLMRRSRSARKRTRYAHGEFVDPDPTPDIGRIELPQRSSSCPGVIVLSCAILSDTQGAAGAYVDFRTIQVLPQRVVGRSADG
jgi:hypothetical protein